MEAIKPIVKNWLASNVIAEPHRADLAALIDYLAFKHTDKLLEHINAQQPAPENLLTKGHRPQKILIYEDCELNHPSLWAVVWRLQQSTDIHDLNGSSGAIKVLAGKVQESKFTAAQESPFMTLTLDAASDVSTCHGEQIIRHAKDLSCDTAISLHAYYPALELINMYSSTVDKRLVPRRKWERRRSEQFAPLECQL